LFLRQYRSPLVYLLLGAAFFIGHQTDALVILVIVRAERSMDVLRRVSASHTRVLRSGREREVAAMAIVSPMATARVNARARPLRP
jgi:hypothetical protein